MSEWSGRQLHFIGIGGAGMSGLALVAQALDASVTGSDRAESSYSLRLREAGIEPSIGHDAANVPDGAEIVVSTAIAESNPELAHARANGLRVLHRGDLLAEASRLKRLVAVSGTHGKTTTSGMVAHVLVEIGRDPAYLIGGELRATGRNASWGSGDLIVVEGDESDRSFLKLSPDIAVVTNIEVDHHATYKSQADVEAAFASWVRGARSVVAWDEAPVPDPALRYGIGCGDFSAAGVELTPLGSSFVVDGVTVRLGVPGLHNVLNALGALGALREAGIPVSEAAPALATFTGAKRRFEWRGMTATGAGVFDDYAHHPTEVAATLGAARSLGAKRVFACFQPHLYSRTQQFVREFGRALALADVVVVMGIYPAREEQADFPGVTGFLVAREASDAAKGRAVYWLPTHADAGRVLQHELGKGDVLLTLGAGDVDKVAEALVVDASAAPPF